VIELRQHYPLSRLLKVAELARSTFYWQCSSGKKSDKYADEKKRISALFHQHKGRYGVSLDIENYCTLRLIFDQSCPFTCV
jgi:hypothetical protein